MARAISDPNQGRSSIAADAQDRDDLPSLAGDLRALVPRLGLRNYWYPGIAAHRVRPHKPAQVRMLGEDLCFFRAADGRVVALSDICPHRGARLSEGRCHFPGTVACPYHGWMFDDTGRNVAVLSEGPTSQVCGKPGTAARAYPTRELKGIVFVWMGDAEPAPIEQDVPDEFFDPEAYVPFNDRIYWPVNWEVALENSMDSHVNYLHRDDLQSLLAASGPRPRGAVGGAVFAFTGNGFRGAARRPMSTAPQDVYPQGWKWPKHRYRRLWSWLFRPLFDSTRVDPPAVRSEWWGMGHRLPGMYRVGLSGPDARGGLFGLYTRQTVPVDENRTDVWYYHHTRPKNRLQAAWYRLLYWTLYRWLVEYNFSQQDVSVMINQCYDWPEKLSGTDAEVIQWRRLVVTKHLGGRDAPFEYRTSDDVADARPAVADPASD